VSSAGIRSWRSQNPAWLLLIPYFAFFLVFWAVPLVGGSWMSLLSNELYGPSHFVGLQHYRELARDPRYFHALTNTVIYTAGSILVILPMALLFAALLQMAAARLRPALTFLLLIPGLTPPAVLALLFLLVFHGHDGILNRVFVMPFGLNPINWLQDPAFILPALLLQAFWRWTGFTTLFLRAGMEGIPTALVEAAYLETNSRWRVFFSVTLPHVRHVLLFAAVYLAVDGFALFSGAYVLLGGSGGTADAGLLLVSYGYQQAFAFGKFGTVAAMNVSLAPLLLLGLWLCFFRPRRQGCV
jgi:ABC-type sugar transport system permease subunit